MLRTRLRWAGFGNVMPGVWLSPRSDRGDEVRRILDEARLPDGYLFTAEYQGGSSLAAMVGHAWDLDELAREYDEFIAAFSGDVSPDPLARIIDLVHAWRRFPWIDPGLPGPVPARAVERHRGRRTVCPAARSVGGRGRRRVEAAAGQGMTLVVRFPLHAVLGEPAAVARGKIARAGGSRLGRGHLHATRATDVGSPFVAALEHDLLEVRRPADPQPPAAPGARPLFDAVLERFRPGHLVWGGQPNSDLQRAITWPSFPCLPTQT